MASSKLVQPGYPDQFIAENAVAMFMQYSKKFSSAILMVDGETGEELTYETLMQKSIQLYKGMKKLGLQADDVITLMSANSINYFVPFLACVFGGFIINPVNPEYTPYELNHCLSLSKTKAIFCTSSLIEKVHRFKEEYASSTTIILFDSNGEDHISMNDLIQIGHCDWRTFLPKNFDPQNQVTCLLNSSGTTGLPKGVMLTSTNLCRIAAYSKLLKLEEGDVTLNVLPTSNIFGIIIFVYCFVNCVRIVVLRKFQPGQYLSLIEKHKVTKLFLVPQLVCFFQKTPLLDKYDISSLKSIYNGGATLSAESILKVMERINIDVYQMYGLTETSGGIIFNAMETKKYKSLGKLTSQLFGKVVDIKTGEALGPFINGELCFKGPNIMKGYKDNAKATAKTIDEDGFLHTGDVGYYDDEGYFYIVDRIKDIIKYKGYQVSPVEIENLLISHKSVKDAAVIGIPDGKYGELPFAYVVPMDAVSKEELQQFVADHLSSYKHLHGGVEFCDEIPKTVSGKILRRKLLARFAETHPN